MPTQFMRTFRNKHCASTLYRLGHNLLESEGKNKETLFNKRERTRGCDLHGKIKIHEIQNCFEVKVSKTDCHTSETSL